MSRGRARYEQRAESSPAADEVRRDARNNTAERTILVEGRGEVIAAYLGAAPWVAVQAPMGAGKTEALSQYLASRRATVDGPLRKLEQATAERLRGVPAGDLVVEERLAGRGAFQRARVRLAEERLVVGTYHRRGLGFYDDRAVEQDVMVIDEFESTMMVAAWAETCRAHRRAWYCDRYLHHLSAARQVIALDAALDIDLFRLVARQAGVPAQQLAHIRMASSTVRRGPYVLHRTQDSLTETLIEAVRGGERVIYVSTSARDVEAMARLVGRGDRLVVTHATAKDRDVQAFVKGKGRINRQVPRLVFASPVITSGLSIDTHPDGSPAYDRVIVNGNTWPGGVAIDDVLQMTGRVRGAPHLDIYLGVPAVPDHLVDLDRIRSDLIRTWSQTAEPVTRRTRAGPVVLPHWDPIVELAVYLRHRELSRAQRGHEYLAERLAAEGWTKVGEVAETEQGKGLYHGVLGKDRSDWRSLLSVAPAYPEVNPASPDYDQMAIREWEQDCHEVAQEHGHSPAKVERASLTAARVRLAAGLDPASPLDPAGPLVAMQERFARSGGAPARLAAIESRMADPLADALEPAFDSSRVGG